MAGASGPELRTADRAGSIAPDAPSVRRRMNDVKKNQGERDGAEAQLPVRLFLRFIKPGARTFAQGQLWQ